MQTRKKSISLHALGVIPSVPRGAAAHRSNSSSANSPSNRDGSHPAKRLKRSHTLSGAAASSSTSSDLFNNTASPKRTNTSPNAKPRHIPPHLVQATPPPSPDDYPIGKIDKSGIKDDIVVAVLEQLEATGNRPHLIKELATVLANSIHSVQSSSNPVAIISSRLTNYLRRPWSAVAPCPLAKEQVNIQPRRVYYYLTTCARQPIPELSSHPAINAARVISPSISSGPDEEERKEAAQKVQNLEREALSPSPELDLIAPEFDHPHHGHSMSGVSYTGSPAYPEVSTYGEAYQQATVPPLESDEREFTQMATNMATRRAIEQSATPDAEPEPPSMDLTGHNPSESYLSMPSHDLSESPGEVEEEETEEAKHLKNQQAASALFGNQYAHLSANPSSHIILNSSPMIRPMLSTKDVPKTMTQPSFGRSMDDDAVWNELKSPDCVELSELDELLAGH